MNRLLIAVVGAVSIGVAVPAVAGPDFQIIEQGRKAKRTAQLASAGNSANMPAIALAADGRSCDARTLVLPVAHGPRAQSTPHLNSLRKERFEAGVKACDEAIAKAKAKAPA